MTYTDEHAYRMRILQEISDMIPDVMARNEITPSQCGRAVEDVKAVVSRRLPPRQFRSWLEAFTNKYPAFRPVLVSKAFLDDENGTWDKTLRNLAHGLVVSALNYETREFTKQFKEPIGVTIDTQGLFLLGEHAHYVARKLAESLQRDGWEPDESIEGIDLMRAERVAYQRDSKKHLIGKAVTVRFRRPRSG